MPATKTVRKINQKPNLNLTIRLCSILFYIRQQIQLLITLVVQKQKGSFLNRYADKELAADAEEECKKSEDSCNADRDTINDPLVIPGECGSCLKPTTKEELLSMVLKCANFAAEKHSNQRRKDAAETPYINHPLGVANILANEGSVYDPIVILAALLHDTVEDTETSFEEIEKEFGETVRKVVAEVTDDKSLPKAERKRLQIENATSRSDRAKLVTLADKIYNLRDIQKSPPLGWSDIRVREYFQWAKKVVDNCRGTNSALENTLDSIFAKQCKETRKNCNCIKRLSPVCDESYLCI